MRLTLALLLLSASTALGQTVTFSVSGNQGNDIVVSKADCAKVTQVTWTRQAGNLCDTLYIWLSPDTCSDTPSSTEVTLDEIERTETTPSGTVSLNISEALTKAGQTCEAQTENKSFKLCASVRPFSTNATTCEATATSVGSPAVTLTLDPKPPAAPILPTVTGLDTALSVDVTAPSDSSQMRVEVVSLVAGEDGGSTTAGAVVRSKDQTSANTLFRMENLENGVEYGVRVLALDKAGNVSEPSPLATGTPVASNGFWAAYRGAQGAETGGCGAGGGGLAVGAVVAALGFWTVSRRKQS
ncbi:MXAN_2561 family MXYO-CTERM-anchored protein [Myxococcus fulvus]|uniref:MXAN_2561 family MXYO-CTERM-anchored protein n=1 Tax=Myxococcus fulvus TaxID=33 RepID=UPI003B9DBE25